VAGGQLKGLCFDAVWEGKQCPAEVVSFDAHLLVWNVRRTRTAGGKREWVGKARRASHVELAAALDAAAAVAPGAAAAGGRGRGRGKGRGGKGGRGGRGGRGAVAGGRGSGGRGQTSLKARLERGAAAARALGDRAAADAAQLPHVDLLRLQLDGLWHDCGASKLGASWNEIGAAARAAAFESVWRAIGDGSAAAAAQASAAGPASTLLDVLNFGSAEGGGGGADVLKTPDGHPLFTSLYDVKVRALLPRGPRKVTREQAEVALQHLGFGDGCLVGSGCASGEQFLAKELQGLAAVADEWRGAIPDAVANLSSTKESFTRSAVRAVRVTNLDFPTASFRWKVWREVELLKRGAAHLAGDHSGCAAHAPFVACAFTPPRGTGAYRAKVEPWDDGSPTSLLSIAAHGMWCYSAPVVNCMQGIALSSAATSGAESFFHSLHLLCPKNTALGDVAYACGLAANVLDHTEQMAEKQYTIGAVEKTKYHRAGVWKRRHDMGHLGLRRWQIRIRERLARARAELDGTEASKAHLAETLRWCEEQQRRLDQARVTRAKQVLAIDARLLAQAQASGLELPMPRQRASCGMDGEMEAEVVEWDIDRVLPPWPLVPIRRSTRGTKTKRGAAGKT